MNDTLFEKYSAELWNLARNAEWGHMRDSEAAFDTLLRQAIMIGASNEEG